MYFLIFLSVFATNIKSLNIQFFFFVLFCFLQFLEGFPS